MSIQQVGGTYPILIIRDIQLISEQFDVGPDDKHAAIIVIL